MLCKNKLGVIFVSVQLRYKGAPDPVPWAHGEDQRGHDSSSGGDPLGLLSPTSSHLLADPSPAKCLGRKDWGSNLSQSRKERRDLPTALQGEALAQGEEQARGLGSTSYGRCGFLSKKSWGWPPLPSGNSQWVLPTLRAPSLPPAQGGSTYSDMRICF